MPHSSGGGSHHGGSHHHSSSHGGSHGGSYHHSSSRNITSRTYISRNSFFNSQRYMYQRHGKTEYFYANRNFKPITFSSFFSSMFVCLLIIVSCILPFMPQLLNGQVHSPKYRKEYSNHQIVISDEADVLKNEKQLMKSLEEFQNITGITPAVITISNSVWGNYPQDELDGFDSFLEKYAYKRYVEEFDDEMHWLIVYSEPETDNDTAFKDWSWEGVIGDDTTNILVEKTIDKFNTRLQANLMESTDDVAISISDAFDLINKTVVKDSYTKFFTSTVLPYGILGGIVLLVIYNGLGLNRLKYRKAVPCEDNGTERFRSINNMNHSVADINGMPQAELFSLAEDRLEQSGTQQYSMDSIYSNSENQMNYQQNSAQRISRYRLCSACGTSYTSLRSSCPNCGCTESIPDDYRM